VQLAVEVKAMPETIPHLVLGAADRWGAKPAVVDEDQGRRVSYAELAGEVRAAAKAFIAAGLEPGEAVGVWAPNDWRWIAAAVGAQAAGGVLVPLNTRLRGREVAEILERAKGRFLVTAGEFLGQDYPAMLNGRSLPLLRSLISLGERRGACDKPVVGWSEFLAAGASVEDAAFEARLAGVAPDDLADIMFTSGTTGLPKGALFTHRQTLLAAAVFRQVSGIAAEDRYLPFGPFSHTGSYKGGWLTALHAGATVYARNNADPSAIMAFVSAERISFMPAPPTVLQTILAHPKRGDFDLSSIRFISTGATMVPIDLIRRLKSDLRVAHVATGYGLTECGGTATFTAPDDDVEVVAHTAGRAAEGIKVKCVRADGSEAAIGEQGEVYVHAAKNMLGYLDDAEATAAALTADGWLRTGDVGALDAAGNLTITDRLKDMYIVGGFNCFPAEIERQLSGYPGVLHCAVIGVPDERLGQVGRAFVVPAPGAVLSETDILAWCRENFANYKVPRAVRFVDSLPMNATGKVTKQALREAG
jgi:acyl-CoA synthetase (AMP-forming)/AMP-acid ligase II